MKSTEEFLKTPQEVDALTVVALAYLAIPNLIFLFGWFRVPVAFALLAAMLLLLSQVRIARLTAWNAGYSRAALILLGATSLAWSAFGGGSHFMYANHDWVIRDAVLGDLVHSEWPVIYKSLDGTALVLRSAIGYFLPPALFGKLFGTAHIDVAIYLWTVTGLFLFLALCRVCCCQFLCLLGEISQGGVHLPYLPLVF